MIEGMLRGWRWAFAAAAAAWGAALAYSTLSARVLYADGAWYVLVHLLNPHRFNDYDAQRSFASFISQAPILLAQRLGFESISTYAALYSVGIFAIPAAMMLGALFLARRQPALFGIVSAAIVIYGFGTNYINTESNILYGLAWLSVAVLALDRPAPILRGVALPAMALAMLRVYEGMLLVGPVLGLWALVAVGKSASDRERIGLTLAGLLFFLGAVIGLGGFLAPRDPANASGFLSSISAFPRNPQALLLCAALAALPAIAKPSRRTVAICAAAAAAFGVAYLYALASLKGYFAFNVYYQNRAFMALSLPAFVAAVFAVWHFRPRWLAAGGSRQGYGLLLVPLGFAVAGDVMGTRQWNFFMAEFCAVLDANETPEARLARLKQSGAQTGWAWTHPSMSLLLRDRGSDAMVFNDPGQFEPFDARRPVALPYRGICQSPLLGPSRPDSFAVPIVFRGGKPPGYVASMTGLSSPEAWGTWSEGPLVEIRFSRPLPQSFDLRLVLPTAFGSNRLLPLKVRAGARELSFIVNQEPLEATLEFRNVGDASTIQFLIPKPESPLEKGAGNDPRKLGIGFASLTVIPR